MKQLFAITTGLFMCFFTQAQQEFHVFPNASTKGNGSFQNPWDLQTALSQKSDVVNGGDTIWLHEGVYDGRFVSTLQSTISNKNIIVASYKNDKVVLNGNIPSDKPSVFEVRGNNVSFRNFEITFIGTFSRAMADATFQKVDGINHLSGEDCEFINLKIHNNPGSGFGSWKMTGGTLIEQCRIFNNGYFSKVRGSGAGIYVQNSSDKVRMIKNNLIFNNYYMGVEVWSAAKNAKEGYVKNISLKNNIIFNNGMPGGMHKNNLIVATDDKNGINRATRIVVENNVFYHNTDIANNKSSGDAGSLQLGANAKSPLQNVTVKNNIIIGGNNAFRLHTAENLTFDNNLVYGGYVHIYKDVINNMDTWAFNNNTYYSKNLRNFRVMDYKDFTFEQWKTEFRLDSNSQWKLNKDFSLQPILNINQNERNPSEFQITLFEMDGKDVEVDFTAYGIPENTIYAIKNIATDEIIKKGLLESTKKIPFPMGTYNDTNKNFGVYKIIFETEETAKESPFQKLLNWLGL